LQRFRLAMPLVSVADAVENRTGGGQRLPAQHDFLQPLLQFGKLQAFFVPPAVGLHLGKLLV